MIKINVQQILVFKKIVLLSGLFLLIGCSAKNVSKVPTATNPSNQNTATLPSNSNADSPAHSSSNNNINLLTAPISNYQARETKKPFGIKVSPQNSPVQPERFSGYHTGQDFEIFPGEQTIDVAVDAACAGKLLMKKYAGGYGGLAIQSCNLDGEAVTIVYGHLRLSSIQPKVGDNLIPGKQIAVLGTGYSTETDGERKHLHFAIHIGTAINILGYVPSSAELSGWLNPVRYLP